MAVILGNVSVPKRHCFNHLLPRQLAPQEPFTPIKDHGHGRFLGEVRYRSGVGESEGSTGFIKSRPVRQMPEGVTVPAYR